MYTSRNKKNFELLKFLSYKGLSYRASTVIVCETTKWLYIGFNYSYLYTSIIYQLF